MGRRRAKSAVAPVEVPDQAISARVAWTYLAVVVALFGTGVVVAITNTVIAGAVCPPVADDVTGDVQTSCQVGFLIWGTIAAFLLCLIPALRLLKLDWWLWAAVVAGAGFLVAIDAATEWWWWACAALIPAVAALISADWGRGPDVRRGQLVGVLILDAAAIAALVWWFFAA